MLSAELRVGDITVGAIHFIGKPFNDRFLSWGFTCKRRGVSFFLFTCGNFNICSKISRNLLFGSLISKFFTAFCAINPKFLGLSKDFDDVLLQSAELLLFQGQTVKNPITIDRKVAFRNIRFLQVKILNRICLFWILRKEEIPRKSSAFFYFLPIVFDKFQ